MRILSSLRIILTGGRAVGKANTHARRSQLEELWDKNIPGLHDYITHCTHSDEDGQREKWIKDCARAPRDIFFLAWVLGQRQPETLPSGFRDILLAYGPKASNLSERVIAFNEYCIAYAKKYPPQEGFQMLDEYLSAEQMDGRKIRVNKDRLATIKWEGDDDIQRILTIPVPTTAVPIKADEAIRTIHFHPAGIDIKAADGTAFLFKRGQRASSRATLDVLHFRTIENKINQTLVPKLWEEVTGLKYNDAFATPTSAPVIWLGSNQVLAAPLVRPDLPSDQTFNVRHATSGGPGLSFLWPGRLL